MPRPKNGKRRAQARAAAYARLAKRDGTVVEHMVSAELASTSRLDTQKKDRVRILHRNEVRPRLSMSNLETAEGTSPVTDMTEEGQVSRHLAVLLSDTCLRNSIVRLAHHIHKEAGKEFTEQTAAECLQQLTRISVLQVPSVKAVMVGLGIEVGSQTTVASYVHNKEEEPRQSVIYLDADADINSSLDGCLQKLVSAIQFVSGLNVESLLLYRILKSPRQASDILDEAGIRQCAAFKDLLSSVSPKPGSFVPLHHHQRLDNDFHEFHRGECAAFEVYDPLMGSEDNDNDVPVYIYATVLYEIGGNDSGTIFAKRYRVDLGPDRGEADAFSTRLYKIITTSASQIEADISSDTTQNQQQVASREKDCQPLEVNAILEGLRQTLTEAWQTCNAQEFRCVTKRLVLKWHADKHDDKESVGTRVTNAIFRYAELLSQGETIPEDDDSASCSKDSVDGKMAGSSVKAFRQRYAQRMHPHAHYKVGDGVANPQPGEGYRWLHTARCDLTSATMSRGVCKQGCNWVCFLCHQAVEKALKGVLYLRDADNNGLQSHSLPHLARQVGDAILQQLAQQMESRMGPHTRMRYPDVLVYPRVPADVYSDDDVNLACDLARRALERVQWLMSEG